MLRILLISFIVIAGIHGLIHLLGFVAYWPLAKISELPYKTALLGGRLDLGVTGMRVYSLLWLLAALGFVMAAIALALGKSFWAPLMLGAVLLSLVIGILDWSAAFRGVLINLVLLLVLGVVLGLRVQPAPLPAYTAPSAPVQTVQFPSNLPKPVEQFYRLIYGDEIPVYTSAVFTARGTLRFMGITFPARMRFIHLTGRGYRHYIETTFYGLPVLKVNEHYLDGHARLALPFAVVEDDPRVDSAANHGLWGEMSFYPASLSTDPRTRWEPVDDTTARLQVPFGEGEQVFTLYFDPQTGLLARMETMRYHEKAGIVRWWGEGSRWMGLNGQPVSVSFAATWEFEGTPWLVGEIEDAAFNTDVSAYIRQTGP